MRNNIKSMVKAALDTTIVRKGIHYFDKLLVRIVLIATLSIVAIIVARLLEPLIPNDIDEVVGASAVGRLLEIIANSMLAVTTFSLTVMVSVYRSASTQWTPRVHRLMIEDDITQNVLATLIGAYIYALVSIILIETKFFADDQRLVLFMFTLLILLLIIVAIVRWVVHLQTLGSLIETTRRIEDYTKHAFEERMEKPCLGGHALHSDDDIPAGFYPYQATATGYLQQIFEGALHEATEEFDVDIYVTAPVGRFVYEGDAIAYVSSKVEDVWTVLKNNMVIGDLRTFEQDPRFGLIVLGEIGSKALSPGINDPGTAIDVLGRMSRIFESYTNEMHGAEKNLPHPRLWVPPLQAADLIEDGFDPIARDGGEIVEVQLALQKSLAHLAKHPEDTLAKAAKEAARRAFQRAEARMKYGNDLERLRERTPVAVQTGD